MSLPFVVQDPAFGDMMRIVGEPSPRKTSDWMRCLVAALTYVATRDALATSTLFTADTLSPALDADTMAILYPLAPAISAGVPLLPGPTWYATPPVAWLVLHPAGTDPAPDLEEPDGLPFASGAILLPGIPEVGIDHKAAWAAVGIDGQVAHMRYTTHARLTETVDLAVLGTLLTP